MRTRFWLVFGGLLFAGFGCATPAPDEVPVAAAVHNSAVDDELKDIDKRAASKVLRRRGAAFQTCYESALKSDATLIGKLVVEFTINERGKVGSASVVKDDLNSTSVSRCVVGVLKRIRFPKPDGDSATIVNSFVFTPNQAKSDVDKASFAPFASRAGQPGERADVSPNNEGIDKQGVSKALRRRGAAFQACYEAAQKAEATLAGDLVVEFTINARGKVGSASVMRDDLHSTRVSRCVVGVLKRIRFPKPEKDLATLAHTFSFSPR